MVLLDSEYVFSTQEERMEATGHDADPPQLRPLFSMLTLAMNPTIPGTMGPKGTRLFDSVAQGRFEGERLRGEIVPGSGDWRLIRGDGGMEVDARAILRTDDG